MSEAIQHPRADVTHSAAAEQNSTTAPTAASLQNPYRRIFTEMPDFATLARRAYDAEKESDDEKMDEKNEPKNG